MSSGPAPTRFGHPGRRRTLPRSDACVIRPATKPRSFAMPRMRMKPRVDHVTWTGDAETISSAATGMTSCEINLVRGTPTRGLPRCQPCRGTARRRTPRHRFPLRQQAQAASCGSSRTMSRAAGDITSPPPGVLDALEHSVQAVDARAPRCVVARPALPAAALERVGLSAGRAPNALQRQPRVAIEHVRRNIGIARRQENEHTAVAWLSFPEGSGNCLKMTPVCAPSLTISKATPWLLR